MDRTQQLDRLAILLSGICLLHCLLAPVVITLLPIFSINTLVEDVLFHKLMLWIVVPTSIIALFLGCKKHRRWPIAIAGALGIVMLFLVAFLGHDYLSISMEKIFTSTGGLILAYSHYLNYQACQSITCNSTKCSSDHHH